MRKRLNDSPKGRILRALCVPCSTGEEPYSLAIALERDGMPAARYHIDGVDMAREHLLRAVAGRYSAFSFRETGADPRPNFFQELDGGKWELRREYRDRIRFRAGNLVDPGFLAAESPYDLILCRNLFIYLTAEGHTRALANLDRLLAADGLLCLTPAEADRLPAGRFIPDGPLSLAIFKRGKPSGQFAAPAARSRNAAVAAVRKHVGGRPALPAKQIHETPETKVKTYDPLVEGRVLADAGNLDSAQKICETALETPSADLFSLLGVIHLAAGRPNDAAEAFRKALYLEPDHGEALTHMMMLCEQRGDRDQAAGLRRRLDRIAKGAAP
jgi:chemotaxis protein methyltransferase WspC